MPLGFKGMGGGDHVPTLQNHQKNHWVEHEVQNDSKQQLVPRIKKENEVDKYKVRNSRLPKRST